MHLVLMLTHAAREKISAMKRSRPENAAGLLSSAFCVFVQPFFERLVKRKWLTNTEPYEQIEALIKEAFKKYSKMDSPPYQVHTSKTSQWTVDAGAAAHVLHLSPAAGVGDPPSSGDGVPPLSHERQDHLHLHEDEEEDGWSA